MAYILGNNNTEKPNIHRPRWLKAAGAAVFLFAAACAQAPGEKTPPAGYNIHAAQETFATGYRLITDRYIDRVSAADLAVEGLKGLQAIDPALAVVRDGAVLRLSHDATPVGTYAVPPDGDTVAWGALTARLALAARDVSRDMRGAPSDRVFEAVFDGALSHLDIFSRYAGKGEATKNRSRRDGFGGVGIRFKLVDTTPVITRVVPGTPAAKAGLRPGDAITHINGEAIDGVRVRLNTVAKRLRGPEHSDVVLTVRRDGEAMALNYFLTRAHIVPETVFSSFKDGVLVARIKRFNRNTALDLARDLRHYRNTLGTRLNGIVLDLRGNPGGLLKQSVKVADLFLTQGTILDTRGRHPDALQHYEAGGADLAGGLPVVVLIDGGSASAAEIVASALQDRGRAVVVGTTSYGKGSVQTVLGLPNDGELTLTWSRFVTPSGYTLHGLGVYPTVCTNGAKDADAVIRRAIDDGSHTQLTMASWRNTGYASTDRRRNLRTACPSESRSATKNGDADLDVATRLLAQPRQYAHARLLSTAPASSTAELSP